jgi:hypothetical protein
MRLQIALAPLFVMKAAKAFGLVRFLTAPYRAISSDATVCCACPAQAIVMHPAQAFGVVWLFAAPYRAERNTFWARVCCACAEQAIVMQRAQAFGVARLCAALNSAEVLCFSWHGINPASCLIGST